MKKKNGAGYVPAVCGKCNLPIVNHPYQHCPYEYKAVKRGKKIVGFMLTTRES